MKRLDPVSGTKASDLLEEWAGSLFVKKGLPRTTNAVDLSHMALIQNHGFQRGLSRGDGVDRRKCPKLAALPQTAPQKLL